MIDLKLKIEALMKGIDKENITTRIKGLLEAYEVMFIYFGGSIAYGTYDTTSDKDLVVFVDGYNGFTHSDIDGYDLFIFGREYMEKRFECDESIPEYYTIFIDDKLALPTTLVYLNEKYKEDYNYFINFDLKKSLKKYLRAVYNYFMYEFVDNEIPSKRFYHVIRIYGQLIHYLDTHVLDLNMEKSIRSEMLLFKSHFNDPIGQKIYLSRIPEYLDFIKEMEGHI